MDIPEKSIFLVGMMGAGKSTVGRLLAQRLGLRFIDADREIEARTGTTISVIFEHEGEAGFRRREAEIIEELTGESGIVLATGGGAVKDAKSREYLKSRGLTIYLRASAADLWQRTRWDRSRPLLQGVDARARIVELLAEREPLYAEVAGLTVETGRPNVQHLVAGIIARLGGPSGEHTGTES